MDSISEQRLQELWSLLADIGRNLILTLEAQGIEARIVQGLRSWQQQDGLWQQGRETAGPIVTDAKGGYSWHNFGMAFDLCPSMYGPEVIYKPDWNEQHSTWKKMEQLGISLGLTSGATWKRLVDSPHFQLTGRFPITPDDEVRQLFRDAGMEQVWKEAGINSASANG